MVDFIETATGRIAYEVHGDGPIDVLVFHPAFVPLDLLWDEPRAATFRDRMARFARTVWFDSPGLGASDPVAVDDRLLESDVEAMLAILDALEIESCAIVGLTAPAALLFAASHPGRCRALVLLNPTARFTAAVDYPEGLPAAATELVLANIAAGYGAGTALDTLAPSVATDADLREWYARGERLAMPRAHAAVRSAAVLQRDLRPLLATIHVPTLVICRSEWVSAPQSRYVARAIAGADLIEVPGYDFMFFAGDPEPVLAPIESFVTGGRPRVSGGRMLAAVMFSEVFDPHVRSAELGDEAWAELVMRHEDAVRETLTRHRGHAVGSTGHGVLATFDGPGRAVLCATEIRARSREVGLPVRTGIHVGEVQLAGADISGMTVHIGSRIASLADEDEILVSRTLADLVAGAGFSFAQRGAHELRGVPGTWEVYALASA
ncbi:MAG TPA: adenylate/guanylate cyclase domain-containing protein [Mycobacteriales bacterium]|nr:adenylate/guanylate cyclase domain-containing protein [Mycobacteriales bacterium]